MPRIGHDRHQRAAERPLGIGIGLPHDQHRGADDDEGEQRADVGQVQQGVDRQEAGQRRRRRRR